MKIQRLIIRGFRGIEAREIVPKGRHVRVKGPNGSGKSSVTLSLLYALAGRGTSQPVRVGSEKAEVQVDLGDWVFERAALVDGKQLPFIGRGKAGAKLPTSPAKFVESLVGSGLALDPLSLYRMNDDDQQAAILDALGVDVEQEDAESGRLYEKRTDVNARRKAADSRVNELRDAGANPEAAEPVSAKELHAKIEALRKRCAADEARSVRVADAIRRLVQAETALKAALAEVDAATAAADTARAVPVDQECAAEYAAATNELEGIDERNRDAQRGAQLRLGIQEAEKLRGESDDLTARIDALAKARADKIAGAAATLGLQGIGFSGDKRGVTFDGVRLAELNRQKRIFTSIKIAFAKPKEMRVAVIDDADGLDNAHLRELFDWGTDRDIQLVIATVDPTGSELSVEIVDGPDEVIG